MNIKEESLENLIRDAVCKQLGKPVTAPQSVRRMSVMDNKREYVPIGISARHIHLSQEHLETLFGKGAVLHPKKELMGGQYAAQECVTLIGTNLRVIENVRVLGPVRKETQVELAKTDAIRLGINPPLRESGDIRGTAPITLAGPKGAIYLNEGCIVAKRHIHMNEEDANVFGVTNGQKVAVEIGEERKGRLEEVQVRVDPSFTLEMHIDTDEANALGIKCKAQAKLIN